MKKFVLIDGHSVLYRAYHAYPALTTKSGELVNAVYGFTSILLSVMDALVPTHIAVTFDLAEPTFRHREYEGYKASRPEAPEELITQQDRVREVVDVLNIPVFAVPGFEADDVIGTLASQACKLETRNSKLETIIVTGDRDALQLVDNDQVFVYMPGRGKKPAKVWKEEDVVRAYELNPKQLIDYKALAGDSSDEIPGVRGIGPKTATLLLKRYIDLDGVYKHLDEIEEEFSKAVFHKLQDGKESAYLSRKLGEIVTDVPLKFSLQACVVQDYDKATAIEKFRELEFTSLVKKLPNDTFENMVQEELFS